MSRARWFPLFLLLALAASCTPKGTTATTTTSPPVGATTAGKLALRLGYLPTLTQATALLGVSKGIFATTLGTGIAFQPTTFPSGRDEAAALVAGSLDAAYLDPNSAISAFQASNGGLRIISGATEGGAYLMTKYYAIKNGAQLRGTKLAVAESGGANDVALRSWLKSQGLDPGPGGNVTVVSEPYASIVQQYSAGQITGAWVPEQWASRMQIEAGATVFVDEASLWPSGNYASAVLVMRADYLKTYPDVLNNLLVAHLTAADVVRAQNLATQRDAAAAIKNLTGLTLSTTDSELAWTHLKFTNDPLSSSIATDATRAQQLSQIKSGSVSGIYSLDTLNAILRAAGRPAVGGG